MCSQITNTQFNGSIAVVALAGGAIISLPVIVKLNYRFSLCHLFLDEPQEGDGSAVDLSASRDDENALQTLHGQDCYFLFGKSVNIACGSGKGNRIGIVSAIGSNCSNACPPPNLLFDIDLFFRFESSM
ncbi:hypothetical protein HG530_002018 [Fusarium avenaceum]|nr:hypothetical protein HG530_002018 [Fusarium avenaceum]